MRQPSFIATKRRTAGAFLAVFGAGLLLSGCATADGISKSDEIAELLSDVRVGESVDRVCFTRGISSFSDATDHSIVVRRGVNQEFLLLLRSCPFLYQAQSVGLDPRSSCLRENDRIFISQSVFEQRTPGLGGSNPCYIDAIYDWDESAEGDTSAQRDDVVKDAAPADTAGD